MSRHTNNNNNNTNHHQQSQPPPPQQTITKMVTKTPTPTTTIKTKIIPIKPRNLVIIVAILSILFSVNIFPNIILQNTITISSYIPGYEINSDITRDIYQLIESRGFQYETHFITTPDGYILQLVRIVNPTVTPNDRSKLKPVLLFHGFQCSGTLWLVATNGTLASDGHYYEFNADDDRQMVNGSITTGNTLGFVLASQGYDVWLGNYRGSIYSSNHTTLDPDDTQFWSFSIDEMIHQDLPLLIDYIRTETNRPSISYIGHSQGTFMMFALLSAKPHYAHAVKPFIALSPVVYTKQLSTPVRHLHVFRDILRNNPQPFVHIHRLRNAYVHWCSIKYLNSLCFNIFNFVLGSTNDTLAKHRIPVYMANIPMGSSSRNAAHFFQMFQHGSPAYFDYGSVEANMRRYQSANPPLYNMTMINSTDIALFYTQNDWFNSLIDVELLKSNLNINLLDDYMLPDSRYNHMDLVWGKEVGKLVNKRILNLLQRY